MSGTECISRVWNRPWESTRPLIASSPKKLTAWAGLLTGWGGPKKALLTSLSTVVVSPMSREMSSPMVSREVSSLSRASSRLL